MVGLRKRLGSQLLTLTKPLTPYPGIIYFVYLRDSALVKKMPYILKSNLLFPLEPNSLLKGFQSKDICRRTRQGALSPILLSQIQSLYFRARHHQQDLKCVTIKYQCSLFANILVTVRTQLFFQMNFHENFQIIELQLSDITLFCLHTNYTLHHFWK